MLRKKSVTGNQTLSFPFNYRLCPTMKLHTEDPGNGIFTVRLFCRDSRPDAVRLSRLFRAVSHTAGENSPV